VALSVKNLPETVEQIEVRITGPGMDMIERTVPVGQEELFLEVPTGLHREITANAAGYTDSVTLENLTGSTTVQLTFNPIKLNRDVFVVNNGQSNRVYTGDGLGDFPDVSTASSDSSFSYGVALGDINNDGITDAFVANQGQVNRVYLGEGSGSFPNVSSPSSQQNDSLDVALGDFNGDGNLDAFVANSAANNYIYIGDGTGSFPTVQPANAAIGNNSRAVSLADFDQDGHTDAFVADHGGDNHIYFGDGDAGGDGYFPNVIARSGDPSKESRDVAVGDFNNDGNPDAFVAAWQIDAYNYIYLSDGNGDFSSIRRASDVQNTSRGVAVGDFNQDGNLDAFVANGNTGGQRNQVYLGDGNGNFTMQPDGAPSTKYSFGAAVGYLNDDGYLDVFVTNNNFQTNRVYLGDGSGGFDPISSAAAASYDSLDASIADFNGQ
jgi:hypothetical protein